MGLPDCPSLVCPNSSWSSGEWRLGDSYQRMYTALGATVGALERGRPVWKHGLRGAPKVGAGAWGDLPQEQLFSSYLSQRQTFQTGSAEDSTSPEVTPRELRRRKPGQGALSSVLHGRRLSHRLSGMCLIGKVGGLLHTFEPQSPPWPLMATWGDAEEQAGRRMQRDNTVLACSLTYKK